MEREEFEQFAAELPVGIVVLKGGRSLRADTANEEFLRMTGYPRELLGSGKDFIECVWPADAGAFEDAIEKCREQKGTQEFEARILSADGQLRWLMFQCRLYYYKDAVPYYMLVSWDISARKELEDELRLLNEQYEMLEEVADDFPFVFDVQQQRFRVPYKYHRSGKILDPEQKYMSLEQGLGDIHEEEREAYRNMICIASEREVSGSIDYRMNVAPEGRTPVYTWYRTVYRSIQGANGKILRIIGRSYDISSDRRIQERLTEEVRLDPLTRLLNKVETGEEVRRYISAAPAGTHVLFLIDIDNFKRINDTFGHTVGDMVIADIAQMIKERFRSSDIVGRVGGDEFLVFMKNTTLEDAVEKAHQLCSSGDKQLVGDDTVISVTMSVGLAVYGVDGDDYAELFEMADRAMYQIKKSGKSNYSFAGDGEHGGFDGDRKERLIEADFERRQEADKEFLNVAFSLLSHARDINGSLNVLLEQIGKKYHMDMVAVFEHGQDGKRPTLTNYWSSSGLLADKKELKRAVMEFGDAAVGELEILGAAGTESGRVVLEDRGSGENNIRRLAGIKFEYAGSGVGGLYLGTGKTGEFLHKSDRMTLCELSRVVAVFVSLRNKLRDDQKEIRHLQDRDKLTGLYNLEAFQLRVERILSKERKNGSGETKYALVHVDINKFSYVNENFGQQVGDNILKEFAHVLGEAENIAAACRMYSDYFVVLASGKSREELAAKVAEGNNLFEKRLKIKYPAGSLRLSTGIYFIEDYAENFDAILESANLARKHMKEQGNGGIAIYKDEMRKKRDNEIQITGRFYGALQKGELELFLQPKFLLHERKMYGAEALARWRLKSGELMLPAQFIPALENMGYIVDLDFYIFEQLLRVMRKWKKAGRELFTISTNFSRRNFEDGGQGFLERLLELTERYQVSPGQIEIEVTESVVAENLRSLKEVLTRLGEMGYRIAIDDFGTGYSSLSVLLEIPADVVKIDKSFTERINVEEQRAFVSQMGQFIHSAKEAVIFEGIETEEQLKFLRDCGFLYGQGYLFDKPLPVEEFERKYI